MWRDARKGTYDSKNLFSDYAWFYKFLNWSFMGCNQNFFIYIVLQDINYWKRVFERVRDRFDFFNRSPCKFSLLDHIRSLFLDPKILSSRLTRFVPKCPKFCSIFIVIIFLEEIDESSGKLIPHGFAPCSFRMWCARV